jgi:hypothetical protein
LKWYHRREIKKILIIEDEQDITFSLKEVLKENGLSMLMHARSCRSDCCYIYTPENASNKASVVAAVEGIPNNMTLDTFTQGSIADLQKNAPSFQLITSNTTTLAGNNPAHEIVFTSLSSATGKNVNKGLEVWTR